MKELSPLQVVYSSTSIDSDMTVIPRSQVPCRYAHIRFANSNCFLFGSLSCLNNFFTATANFDPQSLDIQTKQAIRLRYIRLGLYDFHFTRLTIDLHVVGCMSHSESFPRIFGVSTALPFAFSKLSITVAMYFLMLMNPVLASLFLVSFNPTHEVTGPFSVTYSAFSTSLNSSIASLFLPIHKCSHCFESAHEAASQ